MSTRSISSIALLVALALVPLRSASSHGTGAIVLSTKQASQGATVTVSGKEFVPNSSLRLELRGVLANQVFGRVQTSAKGTFEQVVTIPAGSKPGQYSIVAVGADGDVNASATLMIFAAAAAGQDMQGMPGMAGMQGMDGSQPSAEMMDVPIPITAAGWAVIAMTVIASAATGILLLRSGRRAQPA